MAPSIPLPSRNRGVGISDRACWGALGAAMVAWAGLIMYLTRGTTFYFDQFTLLLQSPGFDLRDAIEPHEGHLGATTRLAFQGTLDLCGADYVAFRIAHVAMTLVATGVFYALVKRRIGALPALAPALVLLFLGSAWSHVLVPIGFGIMLCVAAGLGALLVLERNDRRGDLAACGLLIVSVATFTTGLAFAVAVAIATLSRDRGWRRAWVFVIPVALYAIWWVWSQSQPGSSGEETALSNVLLIPNWIADSLAVVAAAVAGLGYDFGGPLEPQVDPGWGYVIAVIAVTAVALRVRRGGVPAPMWAALGFVLTFWALGALSFGPDRVPETTRYVYAGAVGVLLVGAGAAEGIRLSRRGLTLLFVACAISLATNVAMLRDAGTSFRNLYSALSRAELAMIELGGDRVPPDFNLGTDLPTGSPLSLVQPSAGAYLATVDRYGSPAFTIDQLSRAGDGVRRHADATLAAALGLRLEPESRRTAGADCRTTPAANRGAPIVLELPRGGATLSANGAAAAAISVGRFGSEPSVGLGSLPAGRPERLRIPIDDERTPWVASIGGARSVEVCALR